VKGNGLECDLGPLGRKVKASFSWRHELGGGHDCGQARLEVDPGADPTVICMVFLAWSRVRGEAAGGRDCHSSPLCAMGLQFSANVSYGVCVVWEQEGLRNGGDQWTTRLAFVATVHPATFLQSSHRPAITGVHQSCVRVRCLPCELKALRRNMRLKPG
jgi:hypothetical protein